MSIMSNAKRALAIAAAAATLLSMAACGSSNAASGKSRFQRRRVFRQDRGRRLHQPVGFRGRRPRRQQRRSHQHHDQDQRRGARLRAHQPGCRQVRHRQGSRSQRRRLRPWATKAAQPTKATLVTAAETAGIKEGDNPHVWFSAKVRSNTADAITAAYQKADPSHKDDYAKLNKEWHAKEDQLESKIKETSAKTEGLPYAATESVAWYLADDLKMTDATPKGYAQASANESEPTPADIKDFQDTLKAGFIKMFVFNSQEANSTTDQITGAAKDANVPIVELAEQMPKQYTNLLDWMSALVDQFAAAVK